MKIAFFGSAICGRRNSKPIDTFVDIILAELGAETELKHVGTPGGVTEQQILDQLLATPPQSVDMIVICHSREEADRTNPEYAGIQSQMDQWLSRHQIPVVHCVFNSMPNHEFTWGRVDQEIMQYTLVSRHYRVMATLEESDNGIDFAGNQRAARILLGLFKELA